MVTNGTPSPVIMTLTAKLAATKLDFNRSLYYCTTSTFFFFKLLSLRVMQSFSGFPDHIHTVIFSQPESAQYNHILFYRTLNSCTKAAGVKGLIQGHLSGGNECGASAVFHFIHPASFPDFCSSNSVHFSTHKMRFLILIIICCVFFVALL